MTFLMILRVQKCFSRGTFFVCAVKTAKCDVTAIWRVVKMGMKRIKFKAPQTGMLDI